MDELRQRIELSFDSDLLQVQSKVCGKYNRRLDSDLIDTDEL